MRAKKWMALALVLFIGPALGAAQPQRMLAITIDDVPRADTSYLSGMERARRLIAALNASNVPKVSSSRTPAGWCPTTSNG